MNTSGLVQRDSGFTLTLQETRSIHNSMNRPKNKFLLILTFYYNCLKYKKNIYNLGNKAVFLLISNRIGV